jgi:hypothetical protein
MDSLRAMAAKIGESEHPDERIAREQKMAMGRQFLAFPRLFDVGLTRSLVRSFGHLTVATAAFSTMVVSVAGVPHSWEQGRRMCIKAGMQNGIATKDLANLLVVAGDHAEDARLGSYPLADGLGASLHLLRVLTRPEMREKFHTGEKWVDERVIPPAIMLRHWVELVAAVAYKFDLYRYSEKDGFCLLRHFEAVHNATEQGEREGKEEGEKARSEKKLTSERMAELVDLITYMDRMFPPYLIANGPILKHALRRHLAMHNLI